MMMMIMVGLTLLSVFDVVIDLYSTKQFLVQAEISPRFITCKCFGTKLDRAECVMFKLKHKPAAFSFFCLTAIKPNEETWNRAPKDYVAFVTFHSRIMGDYGHAVSI